MVRRESSSIRNAWPVTIASLLTICITYFTAHYKEYVGRATGSLSLIASSYHSKIDLYASILVLISLFSSALGLGVFDRFAALIVCLLVAFSGWEIASSSVKELLGAVASSTKRNLSEIPHINIKTMSKVVLGSFFTLALFSGFSIVQPDEKAVLKRFGRIIRESGPGLRYHIPFIESIQTVSIGEVRKIGTGSSLVLTGDTNLVNIDLAVQYRVIDPKLFMFSSAKPASFIGQYLETAMREVIATRGVDDLLVSNRSDIAVEIQEKAQNFVNINKTGVEILSIQMVSVSPPSEVSESFRDVASAREDKNTYISEALAYKNELVPISRGESTKVMLTAKADMQKRIDIAFGEANRFEQRSKAYRSGSGVTRNRLYFETMEKALPKAKKYIVDPKVVTNPTQLWLTKGSLSLPTQQ